ncbi:hypothetical protein [Blastococcus saxobsidens]|uniref:Uncharacterized protein n=1 Tax=Blastococcus saxobsidens TaxID=138336 RepID=A0A4V2G2E2_9ACTN|nr:hypothetical protein [Blastococcus saxobsidens]RZU32776.1 hypothetical protein BKA19_2481 [Blastococcus saxobsidens]
MSSASSSNDRPQSAGAFDIRNVIGALIGFYGVVLVIMGLVNNTAEEQAKTGGWNANLWVGIAMLLFGLAFVLWSRLRPVVVDPPKADADRRD